MTLINKKCKQTYIIFVHIHNKTCNKMQCQHNITMELDDYQCWKLAYLITPSYFNIFQLGLAIGSNDLSIENTLTNLKNKFKNNLDSAQYYRMCLFKIILKERNRQGKNFVTFISLKDFLNMGYKDHLQAILKKE